MKYIPMILEVVGNLDYYNQELIGRNKDNQQFGFLVKDGNCFDVVRCLLCPVLISIFYHIVDFNLRTPMKSTFRGAPL